MRGGKLGRRQGAPQRHSRASGRKVRPVRRVVAAVKVDHLGHTRHNVGTVRREPPPRVLEKAALAFESLWPWTAAGDPDGGVGDRESFPLGGVGVVPPAVQKRSGEKQGLPAARHGGCRPGVDPRPQVGVVRDVFWVAGIALHTT